MESVRRAAGLPARVTLGRGAVVVPADPVLARLEGVAASDFRTAAVRLKALEARAREAAAAAEGNPERLAGALARAYRGIDSGDPSWWERLQLAAARVVAEVVRLLLGLLSDSGAGRVAGWVAPAAIGAGLLLLAWRVAARLGVVPERRLAGAPGEAEKAVDWRALAEEALARGDLREAVRATYRALLSDLAERGIVTDAPSLTAGECRAAVARARPALHPAVTDATAAFERVAYGRREPRPEDLEAVRRAESAARAA